MSHSLSMQTGLTQSAEPWLELLANHEVVFEFSRMSQDGLEFARTTVKHKIAEMLFGAGSDFYGRYQIVVGELAVDVPEGSFHWKHFSCGQKGIGFILGQVREGHTICLPRNFSLKPPEKIDIDTLCQSLTGRILSKKAPPLKIVTGGPVPEKPSTNDPQRLLAAGLQVAKREKNRAERALSRLETVKLALEQAEAELARRPDFEQAVQLRLAELLGKE